MTMVNDILKKLLSSSKADDSFKRAIEKFVENQDDDLIKYSPGAPRIKVVRVLMKLLQENENEPITGVEIYGQSSCSGFVGHLVYQPGNIKLEFDWNCYWKAQQEGMLTWYGAPDQTLAARTFGYQCFRLFRQVARY